MNILVISGSRNPQGQTASAGDALIQGIMEAGGTGEHIFLPQGVINQCRQCDDNGWGTCISKGQCAIEDDFAAIVEKIAAADAVAFTTPVYFSDLAESTKGFLDRLRRICMHESVKSKVAGKKAVGICVAGGGGGGAPSCALNLERVLGICGFDVVDMIPVRRQNLDMKREVLRILGKWLAEG